MVALLGGLCTVTHAQRLDSELQYMELAPPIFGRSSEAVEAFDFTNTAVVDAELAAWEERVQQANKQIPNCPAACSKVGHNPATWAAFPDLETLKQCNKTLLLDFAVHTVADGPEEANAIRACSADLPSAASKPSKRSNSTVCLPGKEIDSKIAAHLETMGSVVLSSQFSGGLVTAGKQIASHLSKVVPDCDTSAVSSFASAGQHGIVGVFGGAQAHRQGVTVELLDKVMATIASTGISEGLVAELCLTDVERGADYIVGVAASTKKDGLSIVQDAVRHWSNGTCITAAASTSGNSTNAWATFALRVPAAANKNGKSPSTNTTLSTGHAVEKRAECRYIRVVSGDGCGSLASKCGISGNDFMKYNTKTNLCSTLAEGQPVCCESGSLPPAPSPDSDGYCASYTVKDQDYCAKIAATNQITTDNLEEFNKNTWGWNGCELLWVGINICLSKGNPPMPAPQEVKFMSMP